MHAPDVVTEKYFNERLNKFGKDGWELVSVIPFKESTENDSTINQTAYVFKRSVGALNVNVSSASFEGQVWVEGRTRNVKVNG